MNLHPREYFALKMAREDFLKNMDYYEVRQPFYSSIYKEFNFLTNDLFNIMIANKTIPRYLLISQTLQELRKWLLTVMSNRSLAKMTFQQLFYNSSIAVDDSVEINTKNAMSARLSLLAELNRFNIEHPYYVSILTELVFIVDDLYIIMKNHNTLDMYKIIIAKLIEIHKWLVLVMTGQDHMAQLVKPDLTFTDKLADTSKESNDDSSDSGNGSEELNLDILFDELAKSVEF